jgi:2,4-diketo-3-deoxy-L-fuconate hydrolase
MRIGRANGRLVIVDGDGVVDAAIASGGEFSDDPDLVFGAWDRFIEWAGGYAGSGAHTGPLVPEELGAPVLAPSQVFGIGLNYREHAAESGVDAPDVPPVFTKFRSCLAGPFAAVELPSDKVDWEVELVAVIGRRAERVPEEKAWSYVARDGGPGSVGTDGSAGRPGAAVLAGEVVSRLRADRAVPGDPR